MDITSLSFTHLHKISWNIWIFTEKLLVQVILFCKDDYLFSINPKSNYYEYYDMDNSTTIVSFWIVINGDVKVNIHCVDDEFTSILN